MDLLQIALIGLIFVLAIFLAISGWIVVSILMDLKKALRQLNNILYGDNNKTDKIKQSISIPSSNKKQSILPGQNKTILNPPRFFRKS